MPGSDGRTGRWPALPLWLVLLLVLGSFGLLVVTLVTAENRWAWGSVGTSLLAGSLLVLDWLLHRRARRAELAGHAGRQRAHEVPREVPEVAQRGRYAATGPADEPPLETEAGAGREPAEASARGGEPDAPAAAAGERARSGLNPAVEPDEEDTDAADVIAVADLAYEVVVIDERPRYHLASCRWLADRPTIPLQVRQARELGFTPCVVCTPDAELAARHRLARH